MSTTSRPYQPPRRPMRPASRRPPSKGMAVTSLVLGIIGLFTMGILVVGAIVGTILGIVALIRSNKTPALYGGRGMAIGGIVTNAVSLVLIPVFGIIAAIAIPSLLRARVSANEAQAIGDIRTVISAQAAYASTNGGYYDTLECLANPYSCIPDYPASAPIFIGSELANVEVKGGYRRSLYAGPPADSTSGISPSSMASFAYVAYPEVPNQTGVRAFCGSADGRICVFPSGEVPPIVDGMCPFPCEVLQ